MKWVGYDSCASWFVAIGCCIINTLSVTPQRLVGLLYVILIEHYGIDREKASIPIVLIMQVRCLGGPFIGILSERFGAEEVILLGSFLAAVGFGACFFANDVISLSLLLGLTYGIGMSFTNALPANIIKKHFTRNVNSANGIVLAGPCIGAFIFTALVISFFDTYGVSGTFLILSGIMFNAVPIAMLVKHAGVVQSQLKLSKANYNKNNLNINSEYYTTKNTSFQNNKSNCLELENASQGYYLKSESSVTILNQIQESDDMKELHTAKTLSPFCTVNFERITEKKDLNTNYLKISCRNNTFSEESKWPNIINDKSTFSVSDDLHNKSTGAKKENAQVENSDDYSDEYPDNSSALSSNTQKKIKKFHSLKVFIDPSFIFILISLGLHMFVTTLHWATLIDYSREKGISRKLEIYILIFQPLLDLLGRLGLGWVTDLGYMTLSSYSILCYGLMALSSGWVLWSSNFEMLMAGSLIFALTSGGIVVAFPGMIYKCIEEEEQTMAIASRHLFYGFLSFSASPLIGYFKRNMGSYDGLYYLFIAMCIICCIMMPLLFRFSKNVQKSMTKE